MQVFLAATTCRGNNYWRKNYRKNFVLEMLISSAPSAAESKYRTAL